MLLFVVYAGIIFCASVASVVAGFGFSTISLAILSLYMPFQVALLCVGILHLLVSLYKVIAFKGAFNRISFLFMSGGILFSFIAAHFIGHLPIPMLKKGMGLFLIVYPVFVLYRPQMHLPYNPSIAFLGGSLSGIFAGLIGMGGAIRSFFLSLYNLPKEMFIATGGLIALAVDVTRLSVYLYSFDVNLTQIGQLLIVGLPSLIFGFLIGRQVLLYIPQHYFRLFVSFALALVGVSIWMTH
ncbi:MAG: sulfite exporter TauE/SafE family protein [Candidatus Dependentiae bacterium]